MGLSINKNSDVTNIKESNRTWAAQESLLDNYSKQRGWIAATCRIVWESSAATGCCYGNVLARYSTVHQWKKTLPSLDLTRQWVNSRALEERPSIHMFGNVHSTSRELARASQVWVEKVCRAEWTLGSLAIMMQVESPEILWSSCFTVLCAVDEHSIVVFSLCPRQVFSLVN